MPILQDFEYFKPKSIPEAIRLLSRHKKAKVLAGGTDIINEIKEEIAAPEALVDIKGLAPLKKIEFKNGRLTVGATVTFSELIESAEIGKQLPIMIEVARTVGSVGVRNRATMVGNICSAVPCMDSGPLLSALDTAVVVQGTRGKRRIPIHEWFCAPRRTSLKPGELVAAVEIPIPRKKHAGCYAKLGRYSGEDLAQASVLVLAIAGEGFRVAFGSVGPTPIRARKIEEVLGTNWLNEDRIIRAKNLVSKTVKPITDIRATREYRLHMCEVMFERALLAASSRLNGNGPEYGASVI